MEKLSPLQIERLKYQPKLPSSLAEGINSLEMAEGSATQSVRDQEQIQELFKNTYGKPVVTIKHSTMSKEAGIRNVGVILSGGQAPGGHNVIAGLYDALKQANSANKLYGFLGGPSGIIDGKYVEFDDKFIDAYRNTGGFDIIGSGRTKLETEEQFEKSLAVCKKLNISAVVIIGGDDSNTNAALLAEWFVKHNAGIQVIGCPKTIDGDLKNDQIEISFGFDTATKTYAELIGNIERDANSAKKYWHFVKIMGRSASHVALEAALHTQPNITLISEEVEEKKVYTLKKEEEGFNVRIENGVYIVDGPAIEKILRRANLEDNESLYYFQKSIRFLGVEDRLKQMGIKEGDTVKFMDWEMELYY